MELIHKEENRHILRFDPGEELLSSIQDFCTKNGIKNAWIDGVGSSGKLTLAYYDLEEQEYKKKEYSERLEIIKISGNISIKEGETFCHAHGTFGRPDMSTIGGHVSECIISATAEIDLRSYSGTVKREYDKETGLHLICK